jgi:hypothetical protein
MTTYCKLRSGEWGIKGEGLEEGKVVDVTTKAGVTKKVQVGKVIFTKDAFSIAAITKPSNSKKESESKEEGKQCWKCGFGFIRADILRLGVGDWDEGYCGC